MNEDLIANAKKAKQASIDLGALSTSSKNTALREIAASLQKQKEEIVTANKNDLEAAKANNLAGPLMKRLVLNHNKIDHLCEGINDLIQLEDPVGKTLDSKQIDKGLELYRVSCPIGVIGIIFESRPDALVQISTLCLKSGNAVLLKGGSEARETNRILTRIISKATERALIPREWIHLLETREDVKQMLKLENSIDLIIPRGTNEFVRYIMDNTNIPVLGHADGICHLYIDEGADIDMAVKIAIDSKTQYVAVCNAVETILIHEKTAPELLPALRKAFDEFNVEIRGCGKTLKIIDAKPATEKDWGTEYLDYIVSIKIVSSLEEAIKHINQFGSKHTDAIVTQNKKNAFLFINHIDSGNIFWNCSTRFSDGYRYGLGAEVGISTNKIHARGPVGLEGLVIYKWILLGNGEIVADYVDGKKKFSYQPLDKPFPLN